MHAAQQLKQPTVMQGQNRLASDFRPVLQGVSSSSILPHSGLRSGAVRLAFCLSFTSLIETTALNAI